MPESLIAERQLPVHRKVNISKEKPDAQFRCDAAAKVLTGSECAALERAELAWIFESLRAAMFRLTFPILSVFYGVSVTCSMRLADCQTSLTSDNLLNFNKCSKKPVLGQSAKQFAYVSSFLWWN